MATFDAREMAASCTGSSREFFLAYAAPRAQIADGCSDLIGEYAELFVGQRSCEIAHRKLEVFDSERPAAPSALPIFCEVLVQATGGAVCCFVQNEDGLVRHGTGFSLNEEVIAMRKAGFVVISGRFQPSSDRSLRKGSKTVRRRLRRGPIWSSATISASA